MSVYVLFLALFGKVKANIKAFANFSIGFVVATDAAAAAVATPIAYSRAKKKNNNAGLFA